MPVTVNGAVRPRGNDALAGETCSCVSTAGETRKTAAADWPESDAVMMLLPCAMAVARGASPAAVSTSAVIAGSFAKRSLRTIRLSAFALVTSPVFGSSTRSISVTMVPNLSLSAVNP